jgi:threonyl-tRNA synthetase
LGVELDLFSIHEEAGPGLVLWHPKGAVVRRVIEDFWKDEHIKRGYDIVYTPHIAKLDLWKTSGHWEFYRDYLYSPMEIEGQEYILKPMNCLGHILIYKTRLRSYRELPLRYAELGTVYRYERSGVLLGLSRVRGFTQDDAHIFCRFDQLENEVTGVLDLARFMIDTFGFANYQVFLSTRPEGYAGTMQVWEEATETLRQAMARLNVDYDIAPGEGVFYGPKIDIKFEDAQGRGWQGPTIQVDFNLPERFDVTYIGENGKEQLVAMVHRTVLGSMERFLASLIEHYGGAFPVWLAPLQAVIIPVADRHLDYARKLETELKDEGVRVKIDARSERVNLKIRQAQLDKIPYMVVVGDKEVAASTVSVRLRSGEQLASQSFASFKHNIKLAITNRTKELRL